MMKKTRNALRELLVGWVLREIEMVFEEAGIQCDRSYEPSVGGARRSFVEQHYHTLDFAKPDDARRLLSAVEGVLNKASRRQADPPDKYARQKLDDLIDALKGDGFAYADGKISPATVEARKLFIRTPARSISEVTRRNITDNLAVRKTNWSGRLTETDFLGRIYDLQALPSTDGRPAYRANALADIFQHRENNQDWDDFWIFTDGRLHLADSDDAFLRFLCEMVHPAVRPDEAEVRALVKMFNDHLAKDGWEIYPSTEISKRPVFSARRVKPDGLASVRQAKAIAEKVDASYIARLITRMEESFERDPELAIGTAKDLIESVCKTILDDRGVPYSKSVTLPELSKTTFKQLKLVPEDVPEQLKGGDIIRRILGSLGTVSQGLAELRGLYGAGHGKHGKTKGLSPRHAKLAVGASSALAVFLYETHLQNQEEAKSKG